MSTAFRRRRHGERPMMANLAKANARLRELKYPRNEKQKAASRANLAKAHEASRDPAELLSLPQSQTPARPSS